MLKILVNVSQIWMTKESAFIATVKCRNTCRKAAYAGSLGIVETRL